MNTLTCTACKEPVGRNEAIQRSRSLRYVSAWHPACYTVVRATAGIDAGAVVEDVAGMPLTRRLAELRGAK